MNRVEAIIHVAKLRSRAERLLRVIDNTEISAQVRQKAEATYNKVIDTANRIEETILA